MSSEELKNLRDLHLPDPIGIWPLAYGWYIVIAIILIILFSLGIYLYKKFKSGQGRRLALKELMVIEQEYQQHNNPNATVYRLNVLLKRTCFAYYQRTEIAGLHSKKWQSFLGNEQWSKSLVDLSYQKLSDEEDLSSLFRPIKEWLKRCGK